MRYCCIAKLLLLSGLVLGVGCSKNSGRPLDGGRDRGIGEGVVPPDLGARDGLRAGNVGVRCNTSTGDGCTGQAECLTVAAGVGMCAIPGCTMEDITTTAVEDDCPPLPSGGPSVCTQIQVRSGDGGFKAARYCLPGCTASATENSCKAVNPALTCDPITMLLNGHAEVCLMAACPDAPCSTDPIKPQTTCDKPSGTCQITGKLGVLIGSQCLVSSDCGPGQFCLPETADKNGNTILAGGYCTIIGCEHADPKNPSLWTCPKDSKCFKLGPLSLCLAVGCDPTKKPGQTGCRNDAPADQYTCTFYKVDGNDVGVCWINVKQLQ